MKYISSLIILIASIGILNSQCYPDRHNTTWFHEWSSCEASDNPNTSRGESHWILYDFGHIYKLEDLHFWNINDPSHLDDGLKNAMIDYSLNGSDWVEFGNASFEKASGKSIYEGEDVMSFGGIKTRYLLITATENWGGDCYGFSELKIGVSPITATEMVNFDMDCDEKHGVTELKWTLTNESKTISFDVEKSLDNKTWKTIHSTGQIAVKEGSNDYKYNDKSDDDAYYRIKVIGRDGQYSYSNAHFCSKGLIKLSAYPNPFVGSFEVDILSQNDDPILYSLTDVYGRIVKKGILTPNSTINHLNFEDMNLEAGNYFLIARQGQKTGQLKLVKINLYRE